MNEKLIKKFIKIIYSKPQYNIKKTYNYYFSKLL